MINAYRFFLAVSVIVGCYSILNFLFVYIAMIIIGGDFKLLLRLPDIMSSITYLAIFLSTFVSSLFVGSSYTDTNKKYSACFLASIMGVGFLFLSISQAGIKNDDLFKLLYYSFAALVGTFLGGRASAQ